MPANPHLDLRCIALHPAEDCGWVDHDTALLHHPGEIATADAIFEVPARARKDDLDRKATELEQRQQDGSSGSRPPDNAKVNATEPKT
jgi:hypothetical protein